MPSLNRSGKKSGKSSSITSKPLWFSGTLSSRSSCVSASAGAGSGAMCVCVLSSAAPRGRSQRGAHAASSAGELRLPNLKMWSLFWREEEPGGSRQGAEAAR